MKKSNDMKRHAIMILIPVLALAILTSGIIAAITLTPQAKTEAAYPQTNSAATTEAATQQPNLTGDDLRSVMVAFLGEQVGKNSESFVKYINAHSTLNVDDDFPWCAVFAWSALDQFAQKAGKQNLIKPCMHVTDMVLEAAPFGAHHVLVDGDYIPKPGDLFTTSALERPEDDYRDHIGYVESVETDEQGNLLKVHTIEGNFAWEVNDAFDTYVWRSEWVPGEHNEYGSAICEFLDLEKLLK